MRIKQNRIYQLSVILLLAGCIAVPEADFSMDKSEATAPAKIEFTNLSSNATRYVWHFGDNTTSEDFSPSHIFQSAGKYNVKLIVKGQGGDDRIVRQVVIKRPQNSQDTQSSYRFKNASQNKLYNVHSYFYTNEQVLDLQSHGNMEPDDITAKIGTNRSNIYVSFYNEEQTVFYLIDPAYSIEPNKENLLEFTNSTSYIKQDVNTGNDGTTYQLTNQSSIRLMSVTTYYWDGYQIYDSYEHGNLDIGGSTETVSTSYQEVYISFFNEDFTYYFIVNPPFQLTADQFNTVEFNDETNFYYYSYPSADTSKIARFMRQIDDPVLLHKKPVSIQSGGIK
ncbi:MAG: PKD domain-containing protein [Bacteroidetes bacterium]|jgi:PKD repeat protein|nr:PKD domain-containing protein [Bacteroidota bacterium]